jgi:hypothetical protein
MIDLTGLSHHFPRGSVISLIRRDLGLMKDSVGFGWHGWLLCERFTKCSAHEKPVLAGRVWCFYFSISSLAGWNNSKAWGAGLICWGWVDGGLTRELMN